MLVHVSGQGDDEHIRHPTPSAVPDPALLDAAVDVMSAHGPAGLTLARLADAAGTSRMTLHRREVTVAGVVAGLTLRAAVELRDALFPALTGTGVARDRLVQALDATFDVADRHLPVLARLFADDAGVFHAPPGPDGALPTAEAFVAPYAKLISDGAADGSLRKVDDPAETAAVLFNTAGWAYVQLRHSQRWPTRRSRDGIVSLVMDGLVDAGPPSGGESDDRG